VSEVTVIGKVAFSKEQRLSNTTVVIEGGRKLKEEVICVM
jgi:hypothetical protein